MKLVIVILLVLLALVDCTLGSIRSVNDLTRAERKWVDWIKKSTYPNSKKKNGAEWDNSAWPGLKPKPNILPRAYAVAIATWWSLSEDIFREPYSKFRVLGVPNTNNYLLNYNLCTEKANGVVVSNKMKAPNYVCRSNAPICGSCWQNGLFGMEMSHTTAAEVAKAAEAIHKKSYLSVIRSTLTQAGHAPSSNTYKQVMACFPNGRPVDVRQVSTKCANLIKIWLVRNHLVAISIAVYDNLGCLKPETFNWGYCANDKKFSNGFNDVKNTIEILAKYFMARDYPPRPLRGANA